MSNPGIPHAMPAGAGGLERAHRAVLSAASEALLEEDLGLC